MSESAVTPCSSRLTHRPTYIVAHEGGTALTNSPPHKVLLPPHALLVQPGGGSTRGVFQSVGALPRAVAQLQK